MTRFPTNLIHAQELSPYRSYLMAGGAPVERLFEQHGIPAHAISDPKAMITMRQAYHFVSDSARYAGKATLGASVGRRLELEDLGPLGQAILRASCFKQVSLILTDAIHATEPGSQCWIERDHELTWLCYRPQIRFEQGADQAEQFDLQCLLTILRHAAGQCWNPCRVKVSVTSPVTVRAVDEFANCAIERTRKTTAIAFPSRLLAESIQTEHPKHDGLESPTVTEAVETLLRSLSAHESLPKLDDTAERFGHCGRTLQRALQAEGASYRELTDRLMYERATQLLESDRLPIKAISTIMGYGSSASFIRAFRRYSGVTPLAYRKVKSVSR